MIISASRRTDIPAFYSEWFINRVKAGHVLVPNPFNPKMLGKVKLHPDVVDCIVFWTKNPAPLMDKLDQLKDFKYYFQFTLNPYGKEIEGNLPSLESRLDTFRRLSDKIGKEKVVWRYDPILTNAKYNVEFHKEAFAAIASRLKDHTERCMIGFIDHYTHVQRIVRHEGINPLSPEEIREMAASFVHTVPRSIFLDTCTVKVDLRDMGIPAGMCVDKELIERIVGYPITAKKDKNQRDICRCVESIDIGTYDTCLNGCIYCYANTSQGKLFGNTRQHDRNSPKLIGQVRDDEVVKEREMKSLRSDPTLF